MSILSSKSGEIVGFIGATLNAVIVMTKVLALIYDLHHDKSTGRLSSLSSSM
jgi:hypothetical protein